MDRSEKKSLFEKKKRSIVPLLAIVLVLLGAAGAGAWFLRGNGDDGIVKGIDGQVSIPLAEVADGKAHFYTYRSGDLQIRFFLLKSQDGVVRAAFDTCDVCYKARKGYRQEGNDMVCNNCDQRFRSERINEVKGGCNPTPLERTVAGERVVIAETDLAEGAWYFQ